MRGGRVWEGEVKRRVQHAPQQAVDQVEPTLVL